MKLIPNNSESNIYDFNSNTEISDSELLIPETVFYYCRLTYIEHDLLIIEDKKPRFKYILVRSNHVTEKDEIQIKTHREYLRLKYL